MHISIFICIFANQKYINMRNSVPNKKEHRSNYFKVIDSEVKAYILGYLVADGSIEESTRKDRPSNLVRLRFGCATEDDEIIKLIQSEIAPNNVLRFYQPKLQNRKQITILQICDKELINDLRTLYNIHPRKTYISNFEFPNIPEEFERDFIRGFIDGDGSIGRHHFSMICNSEIFAIQIRDRFLKAIPELKSYIYKENRKHTDYWSLHFSMNLKVAPKLYNYLYKDATVFLKRKEQILNTVLNTVDKRTVSV